MVFSVNKIIALFLLLAAFGLIFFADYPTIYKKSDFAELDKINICYVKTKDDECQELPRRINHFYADFALIIKHSSEPMRDAIEGISGYNVIHNVENHELAFYRGRNNQIYFFEEFIDLAQKPIPYTWFWLNASDFTNDDELSFDFAANEQLPVEFNYRLAKILYHEVAHYFEAKFMVFEPFHCVKYKHPELFKATDPDLCISNESQNVTHKYAFDFLNVSPYASLYATCKAGEDFAETLSLSLLVDDLKMNFKISAGSKTVFDLKQQLQHENLADKISLTKTILAMQLMPFDEARQYTYDLMSCEAAFDFE